MLRGIYSVAHAMEAAARNQDIVAENLTHAVTPGYRRQGSLFEVNSNGNDTASAPQGAAAGPRGYSNFEAGPLQQTGNPLDFALVGNGFFVLEGPNGPLYTRNGSLERGPGGELQSRGGGGYSLRGAGGQVLRIPPEAANISVSPEGNVFANGTPVGQVEMAMFDRPETMRRVGATLFEADNPQTPPPGVLRIEQGFREGSNVQPVQELVSMMIGMRYYEAAEKAMRTLSDAISQNTRAQQ